MAKRRTRLDQPREKGTTWIRKPRGLNREAFGVLSEKFARFMGTPQFILWMTIFVAAWLIWNTWGPADLQFDPRDLNYTLLTLILSEFLTREVASLRLAMRETATRDFLRSELRDLLEDLATEVDHREAKAARKAKRRAKAKAHAAAAQRPPTP